MKRQRGVSPKNSGYALYFGSIESKNDSLDSYCALQARMFLWLSDKGERRAFIVNISDTERRFEFKTTPDGETHSVTLPPHSVTCSK